MKHLKTYKIVEQKDNSELVKKLNYYGITNYTINEDNTVDVDGDVYIYNIGMSEIPFKFRKITGNFNISRNKLTSLKGCPEEVGGDYDCGYNNLRNLIGGPEEVGGDYDCYHNLLETLEGCAYDIGENFYCYFNKLTSLDCSSVIGGHIHCYGNGFTEKPEFFGICNDEIVWKK